MPINLTRIAQSPYPELINFFHSHENPMALQSYTQALQKYYDFAPAQIPHSAYHDPAFNKYHGPLAIAALLGKRTHFEALCQRLYHYPRQVIEDQLTQTVECLIQTDQAAVLARMLALSIVQQHFPCHHQVFVWLTQHNQLTLLARCLQLPQVLTSPFDTVHPFYQVLQTAVANNQPQALTLVLTLWPLLGHPNKLCGSLLHRCLTKSILLGNDTLFDILWRWIEKQSFFRPHTFSVLDCAIAHSQPTIISRLLQTTSSQQLGAQQLRDLFKKAIEKNHLGTIVSLLKSTNIVSILAKQDLEKLFKQAYKNKHICVLESLFCFPNPATPTIHFDLITQWITIDELFTIFQWSIQNNRIPLTKQLLQSPDIQQKIRSTPLHEAFLQLQQAIENHQADTIQILADYCVSVNQLSSVQIDALLNQACQKHQLDSIDHLLTIPSVRNRGFFQKKHVPLFSVAIQSNHQRLITYFFGLPEINQALSSEAFHTLLTTAIQHNAVDTFQALVKLHQPQKFSINWLAVLSTCIQQGNTSVFESALNASLASNLLSTQHCLTLLKLAIAHNRLSILDHLLQSEEVINQLSAGHFDELLQELMNHQQWETVLCFLAKTWLRQSLALDTLFNLTLKAPTAYQLSFSQYLLTLPFHQNKLTIAHFYSLLESAIEKGSISLVNYLLKEIKMGDFLTSADKVYLIEIAIEDNRIAIANKLLDMYPIAAQATDNALRMASSQANIDIVKRCISAIQRERNVQANDLQISLDSAIRHGNLGIVDYFFSLTHPKSFRPVKILNPADNHNASLHTAIQHGHFHIVHYLLNFSSVTKKLPVNGKYYSLPADDLNTPNEGYYTVFELACRHGHLATVEKLLALKKWFFFRKIQLNDHPQALKLAVKHGHIAIVKRLLKESLIRKNTAICQEALMLAASSPEPEHQDIVELLLQKTSAKRPAHQHIPPVTEPPSSTSSPKSCSSPSFSSTMTTRLSLSDSHPAAAKPKPTRGFFESSKKPHQAFTDHTATNNDKEDLSVTTVSNRA